MGKKCLDCGTDYATDLFNCPKCGSTSSIGSFGGEDALAALDAMSNANSAERVVDEAAQLYTSGNPTGAIKKLREALKINPNSAMANFNMGYILLEQGKAKDAVGWIEKALKINPTIEGGATSLARAKEESKKGSGCFIATAVYGSPDEPAVLELRRFRDERLLHSACGRLFVRLYYACSPPVAGWLRSRPGVARWVRSVCLDPIVRFLLRRS